jgi:hypothetical protein
MEPGWELKGFFPAALLIKVRESLWSQAVDDFRAARSNP